MIGCGSVSATGFRQPVQVDVLMDKSATRMRTDAFRAQIAAGSVSAGLPAIRNRGCAYPIPSVVKRAPTGSDAFRHKWAKRTVASLIVSLRLVQRTRPSKVLIAVGVAFRVSFVILKQDVACLNAVSARMVSCAR